MPGQTSGENITVASLQDGAVEICKAMCGKYRDMNGQMEEVGGDMTKIRYVPGLSFAARRLLKNLEHTSRQVPGTQEIRTSMRA